MFSPEPFPFISMVPHGSSVFQDTPTTYREEADILGAEIENPPHPLCHKNYHLLST